MTASSGPSVDPTSDGSAPAQQSSPGLVLGVGCSRGTPPDEVAALVAHTLSVAGIAFTDITLVATINHRTHEPAIVALGKPVHGFSGSALSSQPVPNPSAVVEGSVDTPSVAEAAALRGAGPGSRLVVTKHRSHRSTCAVAAPPTSRS